MSYREDFDEAEVRALLHNARVVHVVEEIGGGEDRLSLGLDTGHFVVIRAERLRLSAHGPDTRGETVKAAIEAARAAL